MDQPAGMREKRFMMRRAVRKTVCPARVVTALTVSERMTD